MQFILILNAERSDKCNVTIMFFFVCILYIVVVLKRKIHRSLTLRLVSSKTLDLDYILKRVYRKRFAELNNYQNNKEKQKKI